MTKRRQSPKDIDRASPATTPLRPRAFAVLAVLAGEPLTGVDILERVENLGESILGPGTLYRLLKELRQGELIERTAAPADIATDDDRRTYHQLTASGRTALESEAERLRRTLEVAGLHAADRRSTS